jgi:hypothetical protein
MAVRTQAFPLLPRELLPHGPLHSDSATAASSRAVTQLRYVARMQQIDLAQNDAPVCAVASGRQSSAKV